MKFLLWLIVVTTSCIIFVTFQGKDDSRERIEEFLSLDILAELPQHRRLFDFSIVPWKIDPKLPRSASLKERTQETRWSLVIFVKSHSSHLTRRLLARMTWSAFEMIDGVRIETVFIVGNAQDEKERVSIEQESHKYGDLLQIDLAEKYTSIGFKTLAGMQYASTNFPSDWMYASADDDMLPDWITIIAEIDKVRNVSFTRTSNDVPTCDLPGHVPIVCGYGAVVHPLPQRALSSKWYLSNHEYGLSEFPTYCFGGFYLMNVKLASELYYASRSLQFFWIDDVWITGFLRLKLFFDPACPSDSDVGLWSSSSQSFSTTGTERELLYQWTKYVDKIHEKNYIYSEVGSNPGFGGDVLFRWDAWLDYVTHGSADKY